MMIQYPPIELRKNMRVIFMELRDNSKEETTKVMMLLSVFESLQPKLLENDIVHLQSTKFFQFQPQSKQQEPHGKVAEDEKWVLVDDVSQCVLISSPPSPLSQSATLISTDDPFQAMEINLCDYYVTQISSFGYVDLCFSLIQSNSSADTTMQRFRVFFNMCHSITLNRLFPELRRICVSKLKLKSIKRLLQIPAHYVNRSSTSNANIQYAVFTVRSYIEFYNDVPTDDTDSNVNSMISWKLPSILRNRSTIYIICFLRARDTCKQFIESSHAKENRNLQYFDNMVDNYLQKISPYFNSKSNDCFLVRRDVSREFCSAWFCDWMCVRSGHDASYLLSLMPQLSSLSSLCRSISIHHLQVHDFNQSISNNTYSSTTSLNSSSQSITSSLFFLSDQSCATSVSKYLARISQWQITEPYREKIFAMDQENNNHFSKSSRAVESIAFPSLGHIIFTDDDESKKQHSQRPNEIHGMLLPGLLATVTYLSAENGSILYEDSLLFTVSGIMCSSSGEVHKSDENEKQQLLHDAAVNRFRNLLSSLSSTKEKQQHENDIITNVLFSVTNNISNSINDDKLCLHNMCLSVGASSAPAPIHWLLLSFGSHLQIIVHNFADKFNSISNTIACNSTTQTADTAMTAAFKTMSTVQTFAANYARHKDYDKYVKNRDYVDPIASMLLKRTFEPSQEQNTDHLMKKQRHSTIEIKKSSAIAASVDPTLTEQIRQSISVRELLVQFHKRLLQSAQATSLTLDQQYLVTTLLKLQLVRDANNFSSSNIISSGNQSVNVYKLCLWLRDVSTCDIIRLYLPYQSSISLWQFIPASVLLFPRGLLLTMSKGSKLYAHYPNTIPMTSIYDGIHNLGLPWCSSIQGSSQTPLQFNSSLTSLLLQNTTTTSITWTKEDFQSQYTVRSIFQQIGKYIHDTYSLLESEYLQRQLKSRGRLGLLPDSHLTQFTPYVSTIRQLILSLIEVSASNGTATAASVGVFHQIQMQITRVRRLSVTLHCPRCFKILQTASLTCPYLRCMQCDVHCAVPGDIASATSTAAPALRTYHHQHHHVLTAEVVWQGICVAEDGSGEVVLKLETDESIREVFLQPILYLSKLSISSSVSSSILSRYLQQISQFYGQMQQLLLKLAAQSKPNNNNNNNARNNKDRDVSTLARIDIDLSNLNLTNNEDADIDLDYDNDNDNNMTDTILHDTSMLTDYDENNNSNYLYFDAYQSTGYIDPKTRKENLYQHKSKQLEILQNLLSNIAQHKNRNIQSNIALLTRCIQKYFSDFLLLHLYQQCFHCVVSLPNQCAATYTTDKDNSNSNNTSSSSYNSDLINLHQQLRIQEDNRSQFAYRCQTSLLPSQCIVFSQRNNHSNPSQAKKNWYQFRLELQVHVIRMLQSEQNMTKTSIIGKSGNNVHSSLTLEIHELLTKLETK